MDFVIMTRMKLLLLIVILFSPNFVQAFELFITEVERPYEPVLIEEEDLHIKQVFLGELDDFPIMYEINVDESTDFSVGVRQKYAGSEPIDFSLILIRENDNGKGVTEIARLRPRSENWDITKDKSLGLTFWESAQLSKDVEPGLYRLEISTPNNQGKYLLYFGEEDESGYFKNLSNAHQIQKYFGYSVIKMLSSSLVYYLLGIIFLIFVINKTWKYRNIIKNAS